jgi:hypothetical protein
LPSWSSRLGTKRSRGKLNIRAAIAESGTSVTGSGCCMEAI